MAEVVGNRPRANHRDNTGDNVKSNVGSRTNYPASVLPAAPLAPLRPAGRTTRQQRCIMSQNELTVDQENVVRRLVELHYDDQIAGDFQFYPGQTGTGFFGFKNNEIVSAQRMDVRAIYEAGMIYAQFFGD